MLYLLAIKSLMFLFNVIITFSLLTRRNSLAYSIFVWIFAWAFTMFVGVLLYVLGVRDRITFYMLNITPIIASLLVFNEAYVRNIIVYFVIWEISTFTVSLCRWVSHILFPGLDPRAALLILFIVVYSSIIIINIKYFRLKIRKVISLFNAHNPIYTIIPVVGLLGFAKFFGNLKPTDSLKKFLLMLVSQAAIFLVYYFFFELICAKAIKNGESPKPE